MSPVAIYGIAFLDLTEEGIEYACGVRCLEDVTSPMGREKQMTCLNHLTCVDSIAPLPHLSILSLLLICVVYRLEYRFLIQNQVKCERLQEALLLIVYGYYHPV